MNLSKLSCGNRGARLCQWLYDYLIYVHTRFVSAVSTALDATDQDAGSGGLYVDFFGRPASTHKAIALLALEHRAPVIVGYARRSARLCCCRLRGAA